MNVTSSAPLRTRRVRVLFVDSTIRMRELIVVTCDPFRFRVTVAAGIPAAARLLGRERFDLLICDDVTTARHLRAVLVMRRAPLVVVVETIEPTRAVPVDVVVIKGPTPELLRHALLRLA